MKRENTNSKIALNQIRIIISKQIRINSIFFLSSNLSGNSKHLHFFILFLVALIDDGKVSKASKIEKKRMEKEKRSSKYLQIINKYC
jgi:hypothetical protein